MDGYEPEDMERLASRLALLASDSGEADNAGRAVGTLARKLGLSGGDIKHIFLAGLRFGEVSLGMPDDVTRLAREVAALRHGIAVAEAATRDALRERDALRVENNALQESLDSRRSFVQVSWAVGATVIAAVLAGTALLFVGPDFRPPRANNEPLQTDAVAAIRRPAVVRQAGAMMRERPDITAKTVAELPGGTRIVVKRLFWNALMQWGEIDAGGSTGYVVTTDISLE